LLGLSQIEQSGNAARLTADRQVQRILPGGERGPRNLQLVVQLAQMQVSGGYIAHQRGHYRFAVLLRAQQIRARSLRGAPKPSPDVHLERKKIQ